MNRDAAAEASRRGVSMATAGKPVTLSGAAPPVARIRSLFPRLLLLGIALVIPGTQAAPPGAFSRRIAVDQFGYLPDLAKVAVISDPQQGFNAPEQYRPGPMLEVRAWLNNAVVFSGAPGAWSNGLTHAQSGDRVWWFDFSPVTNRGVFYVFDPSNNVRSARFRIANDVYADVLKQAARVFYYQRRGAAKVRPFAGERWTDGTNFLGPLQDSECRLITNPTRATQKDLRGGWFDAGDYNKYVNWTGVVISDLLFAYRQNPLIWPDDWNLPESGNGVPDLLDEVKWELDWLLRMQNANGSMLSKVGVNGYQNASPPSAERSQVFYGPASTTATLTAAGNFAQAAPLYRSAGMTAYANALSNAAVSAWAWAEANPSVIDWNAGFKSMTPEVDTNRYAYERDAIRLRAAVLLYDITRQPVYRAGVESNYTRLQAIERSAWTPYETAVQDALLYFTTLPGASPAVTADIRRRNQASIGGADFLGAWTNCADAYRAYLPDDAYHWGNNAVKSHTGLLFAQQLAYGLAPGREQICREAAAGYLHYLHGVNPLTMVHLSNLYEQGAESCANEIYHSWFANGTVYDHALSSPNGPAPGFVTGGANKNYRPGATYRGPRLAPPMDQPPQKAYRDWNSGWPEDSWEITEPSLGYQAPYVFLLSRFVRPGDRGN